MSEIIAHVGDIVFGLERYRNVIEKVLIVSMNGDCVDIVVPIDPFEKSFVPSGQYSGLFYTKKAALCALQNKYRKRKDEIAQELDENIAELEQMKREESKVENQSESFESMEPLHKHFEE